MWVNIINNNYLVFEKRFDTIHITYAIDAYCLERFHIKTYQIYIEDSNDRDKIVGTKRSTISV